ncbi:MAG: 16S rRNA (guanine(527)-N(7))-methyltransferase RsmG [Candidatus Riflebacteria bacterium]|nr:16S rRNA (guanine(527)-N(7))-methyltransferase RsmG [Candidatus Riflebacteria bacterium]
MSFSDFMTPWLEKCKIDFTDKLKYEFDKLGTELLADDFYSSVSKIRTEQEVAEKHFFDSLLPISFESEMLSRAESILDVGSGGGFPLFPLALFYPQKNFFALDSRNKSVEFIDRLSEKCNIYNIQTIYGRAEETAREKKYRGKFDLVICRAVGEIRIILELCIPFVKLNGTALFYKGPKIEEELFAAENALDKLKIHSDDIKIHRKEPPDVPFSRGFVMIKKTTATPDLYPRRNGLPSSKPL